MSQQSLFTDKINKEWARYTQIREQLKEDRARIRSIKKNDAEYQRILKTSKDSKLNLSKREEVLRQDYKTDAMEAEIKEKTLQMKDTLQTLSDYLVFFHEETKQTIVHIEGKGEKAIKIQAKLVST